MTWFVFLCMVLTAYRVTRLITKDDFPPLLWLRDGIVGGYRPPDRAETYHPSFPKGELEFGVSALIPGMRGVWSLDGDGEVQVFRSNWSWVPHWLAELYGCPWCVSAYVSGALTLTVDLIYGLPVPWLVGPAVWALAALAASREWA